MKNTLCRLSFLVVFLSIPFSVLSQNPDFKNLKVIVLKRVEAYQNYSHSGIAPQRLRDTYLQFKVKITNNGNIPLDLNFNYIYGVDKIGKTYPLKFPSFLASKIKTLKPKKSLKQTLFFEPAARHKPVALIIEGRQYPLY